VVSNSPDGGAAVGAGVGGGVGRRRADDRRRRGGRGRGDPAHALAALAALARLP
jgi:hypothetical protein